MDALLRHRRIQVCDRRWTAAPEEVPSAGAVQVDKSRVSKPASEGGRSGKQEARQATGRNSATAVPCPGALRIVTCPPSCRAKPNTWLSPSPVPWPMALVVKNGSIA